jgi:2-haloacid dehalogenase
MIRLYHIQIWPGDRPGADKPWGSSGAHAGRGAYAGLQFYRPLIYCATTTINTVNFISHLIRRTRPIDPTLSLTRRCKPLQNLDTSHSGERHNKMPEPQKHVVFDVVGTCVSFDAYYERIESVLGEKLRKQTVTAQHFGFTWQTAAELEFTFLSIQGSYKAYKDVLRGLFYRTLSLCGVSNPRELATAEEREQCIEGYSALKVRPGCQEAFELLRNNGFKVWCLTTGDIKRVGGYFERAGINMPSESIVSCDVAGSAKPALPVYQTMYDRLGAHDVKWFAAAHMWDVSAATKVGFRGAWTSVYEKEACLDVFSEAELEVVAGSLVEMAQQIIEKS